MTQDEIIEMAMQAEFVSRGKPSDEESELFVCLDKDIYKFAELIVAKEQDRCCAIVFAQCESDNVAQRTVDAIRGKA